MHTIIAKYTQAYHQQAGSSTEKVKKILMAYAHTWDWAGSATLTADLIDDVNITAEDIVDFLADTYDHEGGNEEFHYAVRSLQICLRKAHLAGIDHHFEAYKAELDPGREDGFDDEAYLYLSPNSECLHVLRD